MTSTRPLVELALKQNWSRLYGYACALAGEQPIDFGAQLGDLLAGTYAERTRAPKLPPAAGGVPPVLAGWATVADVARLPDRVARRAAQFVRSADALDPAARTRAAATGESDAAPSARARRALSRTACVGAKSMWA